ncbi:hypothetical protein DSL72_006824 [Monilinia vaccinii-corymbosi]|uniref:AB hydrolase-1 domain-containing protein n=1 Tax=Monilinia vaccinii-corymbosi TaxID=61207 RepID=A0A8A3PK27_9HELO|nr:hypothetical protein DSL72_006824 [Monilinia vaccinii-corymbosi]
MIPELSRSTTCIAFDTPGSGLSSLAEHRQSVESIVEDAVALLDGLLVNGRVWVVGHSMGGMIACELAFQFPQRVKGLVLLGPINPSETLAKVFTKRIEAVTKDGVEFFADTIPHTATGSNATSTHRAFIRSLILGTSTAGYLSLCQVIARAPRPKYTQINVPVMVLAGSDDMTASYNFCKMIYNSMGVAEDKKCFKELPGVGHWHAIEAPDLLVDEISRFILSTDQMEGIRPDLVIKTEGL